MTALSRTAPAPPLPGARLLRRAGRAELLFVAGLNGALIGGMWVRHGGTRELGSVAGLLTAAGQLSALFGTAMALLLVTLVARVPWLEAWFGSDRLRVIHRWLGFAAVWLLVIHGVTTTLGFAMADGIGPLDELAALVGTEPWVLAATVSMGLFALVAVTSVRRARRALSYETWHGVHLYAYLALILGFGHQVAIGSDLVDDPVARAYWIALYAAAFGAILAWRVGLPVARSLRHQLRVSSVVPEAPGVVSIYLRGRDLERLPVRAGQFVILRFLREGWWRGHPFSISAQPNGRWLRVTVKALGDDTTQLQRIPVGTPVMFEGPYGALTADRGTGRDVVMIAGGVGLAPLRALAEELSGLGTRVTLLVRASRPEEVCFRDELALLASRRGVRVHEVLGRRGQPGVRPDPLDAASIRRLVPDVARRDAFVCGPAPMMHAVRERLRVLGVPDERIHDERFGL